MKYYFLPLLITLLGFFACENTAAPKAETTTPTTALENPSFEGEWTRSFHLGEGSDSMAHVFYSIGLDSIQYEMQGMMPLKYTIKMDTFIAKEGRWVGMRGDNPYVIFMQPLSADAINIFKQKVESLQIGREMPIPGAEAKSRFTSWNIYHRQK